MEQIIINQMAVGIFLLITLWVGLQSKRATSMEEYATAGKSLSSGVLMISLIATMISSLDIGAINRGLNKGFIDLATPISICIMTALLGSLVYPKLIYFRNSFTISDLIKCMYGELASYFTLSIGVIVSILVIASQLKFIGGISKMIGVDTYKAILIFGITIIFYTCVGGIKSVTYTDLLQFGCIIVGTFLIMLTRTVTESNIATTIELPNHYSFWNHPRISRKFLATFFWGIWPTLLIMPPIIQRLLFFRKKENIGNAFIGVSVVYISLLFLFIYLGVNIAFSNPDLVGQNLTISVIINHISNNVIACSIFILVPISIIMSTIDSFINASVIDIIKNLEGARLMERGSFIIKNQFITIILGGVAILIAMLSSVHNSELLAYSVLIMSILVLPLLSGIIGFKGHKLVFWIFIISFFLVFFLLLSPISIFAKLLIWVRPTTSKSSMFNLLRSAWFIAILTSSVIFFLTHYLVFGGFAWEDRMKNMVKTYSLATIDWLWWTSPVAWADRKAKEYGTEPYWVGLFIYVVYFIPYVTIERNIMTLTMAIILRSIGVVLVTLLLIESIWKKKYLPYFNLFYYATIFFCVPFSSIMLSWQDPQGYFTVHNIVLEIILLIMLVDWQTFLSFNIASLLFSMVFQKLWHGYFIPDFGPDAHILLGLNVIYSLAVCLIFARKKQIKYYIEKYNLTQKNKDTTNQLKVQQEAHRQLASSLDPRASMIVEMSKVIERQEQGILDPVDVSKLKSAIAHLTMLKDKSLEYLPLKATKATLQKVVQNVGGELKATGWAEKVDLLLHLQDVTNKDAIRADMPYLQQLLFNSVKYQCRYYQATQVRCTIAPVTINYSEGNITNEKKGYQFIISIERVKPAKKTYHISQKSPLLPTDKAYLHTNLHITTSHFGIMEVNETKNACILTYVLPCDVNELKTKIPSFVDEDLRKTTLLTDEADIAFLELAVSKGLHKDLMERALRTCKHYHRHQQRHSGELFYLHPVAVTTLLLDHTTEPAIIVAGLLHDTIEDTPYTAYQMTAEFGAEVTKIVRDITNLYDQASRKVKFAKQEVFTGLLKKENEKALLVKLLDRQHNLQTIHGHQTLEKQKAVATETLQFFVPLAQKLGKAEIEKEFRSVCERVLARKK